MVCGCRHSFSLDFDCYHEVLCSVPTVYSFHFTDWILFMIKVRGHIHCCEIIDVLDIRAINQSTKETSNKRANVHATLAHSRKLGDSFATG